MRFKIFLNAGQTCVATDYILVENEIKDRLIEGLKEKITKFYGENPQESRDFERVINRRHTQRLKKLMDGQNIIFGGVCDESQNYISPTIVLDPNESSPLMTEEIFGPILPILSVPSVEAAINFINSKPKPLALYIFSANRETQQRVISRTSSGAVAVNDAMIQVSLIDIPFGGVGDSGMGAYHGKYSFDTFSHYKAIFDASVWMDPSLRYPPYSESKLYWLKRLSNPNFTSNVRVILNVVIILPIAAYIGYRFLRPRI